MSEPHDAQLDALGPHRGAFFRVLSQTARTQCAVMTIAPGADGGPALTAHDVPASASSARASKSTAVGGRNIRSVASHSAFENG